MLLRDLEKGSRFRVTGWDCKIVLTVIIPLRRPIHNSIKLCHGTNKEAALAGFAVLAGRGRIKTDDLHEDLYVLPITTQVEKIAD